MRKLQLGKRNRDGVIVNDYYNTKQSSKNTNYLQYTSKSNSRPNISPTLSPKNSPSNRNSNYRNHYHSETNFDKASVDILLTSYVNKRQKVKAKPTNSTTTNNNNSNHNYSNNNNNNQ